MTRKTVQTANPHISSGCVTKRCRSIRRQGMRMRLTQMYYIYFKEGRLSITQYASVLCAFAVVTLVRYAD